MDGHLIEYRHKPGGEWEEWAFRVGTRAQARKSAEGLLASLWEEGSPRARVRMDGQAIRTPNGEVPAAEIYAVVKEEQHA